MNYPESTMQPHKFTKICSKCGLEKAYDEFHRRRHHVRSGRRSACRACTRIQVRVAREHHQKSILEIMKQKVRSRTWNAIARGDLTPFPCKNCGKPAAEAHHVGYEGVNAHLDVVWLCSEHHTLEHASREWTRQLELWQTEHFS